ncbi:MAG: malT [Chloroflexi bacterium]|jgi:LuxR family maltose regulon positive regulatory protein|nr:malT [Chloroflexota bacterium]
MLSGQEQARRDVETDGGVGDEWQGVRTLILILPFAMTESRELLDTLRGSSPAATGENPQTLPEELSPRELRVLRYLPTNLTRTEIAGELHVTVNTINTHVRNIYSKLGTRDRSAAVRRARELRLLASVASR